VKAIDKESEGVTYLRQKFPKIGKTKKKKGIFVFTNYTTILRPRLWYKIKFYGRKGLEGTLKKSAETRERTCGKLQ